MEPIQLGVSAVGGLLKPFITDIYNHAKSRLLPNEISTIKKTLSTLEIGKQVYKTINVKTLWNAEKETSLFEFYYPSRLLCPDQQDAEKINSISQLNKNKHLIIEGTAGQGKSIFLRYLYGQTAFDIEKIRKIPIFIELRRITEETTASDLIITALTKIGLPATRENLKTFFESNYFSLLLDAFDEIEANLVGKTVTEIEDIASLYDEMQILITARPGSAIQQSAFFRVSKLDPLNESDHRPFLDKVCANKGQATEIHKSIQSATGTELETLLSTPLLLTLLVLLYRAQLTFPNTLSRFYEQLFDVMLFKHDQTKPGFRRNRYTNLDEIQLKQLFEAFAFQSRVNELQIFNNITFEGTLQEAIEDTGITVSPAGFRKELIKTACLLIEDGLELSFIHKSVAEYYAATFIQRSGADFATNFYQQMIEDNLQINWSGELSFLENIDPYRFRKYYLLPSIEKTLNTIEYKDSPLDVFAGKFFQHYSNNTALEFKFNDNHWVFSRFSVELPHIEGQFGPYILHSLISPLVIQKKTGTSIFRIDPKYFKCPTDNSKPITLTIREFGEMVELDFISEASEGLNNTLNSILKKKTEAIEYITREENKLRLTKRLKKPA